MTISSIMARHYVCKCKLDDIQEELEEAVAEFLSNTGMTDTQLAAAIPSDRTTVCSIRNRKRRPTKAAIKWANEKQQSQA